MQLLLLICFSFLFYFNSLQEGPGHLLTPSEYKAHRKKEKGILLDVRTPEEYQAGHLKNSKNSDFKGGQFAQEFPGWNKKKTYYLYCTSGNRSGKAVKLLQEAGFTKVYNLGGYNSLKAAGFKIKERKKYSSSY